MATLQATTASNHPTVDPDAVEAIESIVEDYDFYGSFDSLTIGVVEPDREDADPYLELYGYASFEATKPILDENGSAVDREYHCTEKFLERLAPHLEDQLVVETVGFEKCRFPLLAGQWSAWPDGTVTYNSFDHAPENPTVESAAEDTDATSESSA
ncbi:hypothetical protein ACERIT_07400 [Halopenitus sp. H-Gu1]|uniref:hypothetical protein n=1 Tax=Halopenitus sp. H-Gu1 TaxID=3242697 RepID=UPI00359E3410